MGVATVAKMNLLIGAGIVVLLAGLGTVGAPVFTVPTLAAVCGLASVAVLLIAVSQS
jgi:hypothetical protein